MDRLEVPTRGDMAFLEGLPFPLCWSVLTGLPSGLTEVGSEFTPGAQALVCSILSSSFQVTFLSLVGKSVRGRGKVDLRGKLCCEVGPPPAPGSLSQRGRVSPPSDCPRHPWGDLSVGAQPAGFLFHR